MKPIESGICKEMGKRRRLRKWTIAAACLALLSVATTVRAQVPPSVTVTPASLLATNTDKNVTFTATETAGDTPVSWQWHWVDSNGVDSVLLYQTNATLVIPVVSPVDIGGYYVVAVNDAGTANSTTNSLSVITPSSMPIVQTLQSSDFGWDPLNTNSDLLLGLVDPLNPQPLLTDGQSATGATGYGQGATLTFDTYGHCNISGFDTFAYCQNAGNPNALTCNQHYTIAVSTDNGNTYSNLYTVEDALQLPFRYDAPVRTWVQLTPNNGAKYLVTNVDHVRFIFYNDYLAPNLNDIYEEFMAIGTNTLALGAPVITKNLPASIAATYSLSYTMSVSALANPIPSFQWYRISGGATNAIGGATSPSYTVNQAQLSDNGAQYQVIVTNLYGSVTSAVAKVTLFPVTTVTNTIYYDTFGRSGVLSGSMPSPVDTDNAVWGCINYPSTGTNFITDGLDTYNITTKPATVGGTNQSPNIFLPFTPQWGHVYTLSCDITSATNNPGSWVALGYAATNSAANYFAGPQIGAADWMLAYPNGSNLQCFQGVGTGNRRFYGTPFWNGTWPSNYVHFACVLNTTTGNQLANSGWTISFYTNNVAVTNGTTISWTYPSNPYIGYVGIGAGGTLGLWKNFKLTDVTYKTIPATLTITNISGQLDLQWPSAYQGWLLQSNVVGLQATNAWSTVTGSGVTNRISVPVNHSGNAFFRLQAP